MATGKFENISMWVGNGQFHAEGKGPDDGRGESGPVSFFYHGTSDWIKFAAGQCGAYDHHAPNEITAVESVGPTPKGAVNVVVCFDKHNSPPNVSSSDPVLVTFPK